MRKAPQTRTTTTTRKAAEAVPSADQIARRAHEIFVARGCMHGRDVDDWLQAERELQQPNGARRRKPSATRAQASAAAGR